MIICALSRSWIHHSTSGGMEIQLYFLIRDLCKLNHTFYLITTPSDIDTFTDKINGLHLLEIPNCPSGKYSDRFFQESTKIVMKLENKIDLLYYVSGGGGCSNHKIVSGSVIDVFKKRLPSVITMHNGCKGQELHFREIFKCVNGVVFSHKEALFSTNKLNHSHVNKVLIPTSTDCDYSKLKNIKEKYSIPNNNKIITFIAKNVSLNSKGFDIFLKITELINNTITFIVVGKYNEKILNKKDNIIYTGKIPNSDVKNILFSSDYYLTPTDWKTKGFDGTISEALLAGTRVIATKSEIGDFMLKADNKSLWYFEKNEYIEKTIDLIMNNKIEKDPINSINFSKQFSTEITMLKYEYFFQLTVDSWDYQK
jgi:hypothetical protein